MTNVSCLAAADDDSTFSVILLDGSAINGVRRATFDQAVPTGIQQVGQSIFSAHNVISLSNLPSGSSATIIASDGRVVLKATADNDIDISALQRGVYIVRVGDSSFKFRKL